MRRSSQQPPPQLPQPPTRFNRPKLQKINIPGGGYSQMKGTLKIIGDAIVDGSRYLPIRNRAAALATTALPKDYMGQVGAIFADFVKRWRYVRDPYGRELVHRSPKQVFELVMGGRSDSPGVGFGKGAGDCDDATVAIGAQLASIGFPVRIATIAPLGAPPGRMMSHVFIQTKVPGIGWVTVDPVVFPKHGLGYTPPHSRIATWDLTGQLLDQQGNGRGLSGMEDIVQTQLEQWRDYAGMGDYTEPGEELLDFRVYGIKDFGIYADYMGMMGGCGLMAEVEVDESGRAWTPALELRPEDYRYMAQNGVPYEGMPALGDNGSVYMYDPGLGFFKSIFSAAKSAVSSAVSKAKSLGKSLISKIPGGKYLMKLGNKVWKISKKLVGPLARFVGPLAKKLAPVAALIPGYGPAIAAALYTTGKITDLMKKYGVSTVKKKGGPNKLKFKSGSKAKAFQKALKKLASKQKKRVKAKRKKRRGMIARGIPPQIGRRGLRRMRQRRMRAAKIQRARTMRGDMGYITPLQRARRRAVREKRIRAGLPVRRLATGRRFAPFLPPGLRRRRAFFGDDTPTSY